MGKKMKFPYLFKATESNATATTSWPWPTCVNSPKTLSFRANTNDSVYKTVNSTFLDDRYKNSIEFLDSTPDSYFGISNPFEHNRQESFSCEQTNSIDESAVIQGQRSDRLFFEPGETNSILEEAKARDFPYKESVSILAMDSRDPFLDFRVSMEEMVAAHGLKEWECLEELLTCYLRINGKSNHGYVIGAFVDLLLHLALASDDHSNESSNISAIDEHCSSSSTNNTLYSFTSPLSFSSSTCSSTSPGSSSLENEDEIVVEKNGDTSSLSSSSCHASSSGVNTC